MEVCLCIRARLLTHYRQFLTEINSRIKIYTHISALVNRFFFLVLGEIRSTGIEKRGIFIFADLYISFQPVVHCAAVIYDGIVNVPAGERCKSSHIRLILQRRSADSLATNGVKVIITLFFEVVIELLV